MNKVKRTFWGMAGTLLCIVLGCTACSPERHVKKEKKYTIGVVTKSSTSEYWMSLCEGIKTAAEEYDMDLIILQPDMETNKEAQIKMIETLARKNVDMIAVSPIDSQSPSEYLEAANQYDIPLISYDDGFDSLQIPYVGIDNENAGYELMKYLAEQMDHKGEVGIISGHMNQRCHRQRVEGAKRYLEEEPNMTLAYVESGYSNLQMREEEIERLREQYPKVKGIMVTSAATAMGITEAVSDEKLKIVSVDAQKDALDALKTGKITALIAQYGYEMGYELVEYISELQNQETEVTQKILDAKVLTQDNVEEYMESVQFE